MFFIISLLLSCAWSESVACIGSDLTVPIERVDDDFCDCYPGHGDEPHTSACSNGVMVCKNEGFISRELPSSFVNDGVCDCCDGSDEWRGRVECADFCRTEGDLERKRLNTALQQGRKGYAVRESYIRESKKLRVELEKEVEEAEAREDGVPIKSHRKKGFFSSIVDSVSPWKKPKPHRFHTEDSKVQLARLTALLSEDFGSEDEYLALKGKCIEKTVGKFIYRLCPFEEVTQSTGDGDETRLGQWSEWNGEDSHLYNRGDRCWQGDQRRVSVSLVCGDREALLDVTEPSRCRYHIEWMTCAACSKGVLEEYEERLSVIGN